ncbi:MAG: phosphonatase-like hydrolase [Galactobacter sp.]
MNDFSRPLELLVCDMAGTTVRDDGVVEQAFRRAAEATAVLGSMPWDEALDYVRATMGQSKLDVFTHLAGGDTAKAADATVEFERAYADLIANGGVEAMPGAEALFDWARSVGVKVALTTGFSPKTRDAILDDLGWQSKVDLVLSPADVGRGRPAPDLVLTALIRTETSSVECVAVVGDTSSDMESGRRAGAGLVVGVTSGAHDRDTLTATGADAVLANVSELHSQLSSARDVGEDLVALETLRA